MLSVKTAKAVLNIGGSKCCRPSVPLQIAFFGTCGKAMIVGVRPPGERTIVVGIEIWRWPFDQPHSKNIGVTGKAISVAAAF
jgi:hypothetical protein